jgi:hypothetical protein
MNSWFDSIQGGKIPVWENKFWGKLCPGKILSLSLKMEGKFCPLGLWKG